MVTHERIKVEEKKMEINIKNIMIFYTCICLGLFTYTM